MYRALFTTDYFVYRRYSPELRVFYIGGHHCKGTKPCTPEQCLYKSSSKRIRELEIERPKATWEMFILGWANDRASLSELELKHIRVHIDEPNCLNLRASSKSIEGARSHRRRVEMIDHKGVKCYVRPSEFIGGIKRGLRATNKAPTVNLRNDRLMITVLIAKRTVENHISALMETDWQFGHSSYYRQITAAEFKRTLRTTAVPEELGRPSALALVAY